MNKLSYEPFLIVLLPIIAFMSAYFHKFAKFKYYNIPTDLIKIDYNNLIFPSIVILGYIIIVFIIYIISSSIIVLKNIRFLLSIETFYVLAFLLMVLFESIQYFFSISIYAIIFFIIIITILQVFNIVLTNIEYNKGSKFNYNLIHLYDLREREIEEIEEELLLTKNVKKKRKLEKEIEQLRNLLTNAKEQIFSSRKKYDNLNYTRMALNCAIWCLIVLQITRIFYEYGLQYEQSKDFYMAINNKIVLDISDNRYILSNYNQNHNTIDNQFTIISPSYNSQIDIKYIKVRPGKRIIELYEK